MPPLFVIATGIEIPRVNCRAGVPRLHLKKGIQIARQLSENDFIYLCFFFNILYRAIFFQAKNTKSVAQLLT